MSEELQIPQMALHASSDQTEPPHIPPVEHEPSPPLAGDAVDNANVDIALLQAEWRRLMDTKPVDGDVCYVIPRDFIQRVLSPTDCACLKDFASFVGKLDNTRILDAAGNLFPLGEEKVETAFVSPELYRLFQCHFGLLGPPVIRNVLVDAEGNAVLERFPPYFLVHTLCKNAPTTRAISHIGGLESHSKCAFLLSQTKTFKDLVDTIRNLMNVDKNSSLRVWFITTDNVEELSANIPVSSFINKIQHKKIVTPQVMKFLLQSQGIRSSRLHLVVEVSEKSSKKFILDQAVASTSLSLFDMNKITTTGGNLGLSNLGNTCYMNSALQCLVHVPEINFYFFYDLFEKELNRSNPLGNLGDVAVAFSNLLHKLFDYPGSSTSLVTPREFKYTIGRYSSMFHGYQQQDSQEFLSWLLDALHEDLNRIYDKPYCEKPELKDEDVENPQAIVDLAKECWNLHKKRNDSVIVDLFTGMYQSTLLCPVCYKKSVTFDPFNDLTLPLPVNKKWYHEFTIVDLSGSYLDSFIMKLEVELSKSSTYEDLVAYLSKHLGVPRDFLFLFEIFRNFFYKDFQEDNYQQSFLPINEIIGDDDAIFVYIIPYTPDDRIIPVINVAKDEDRSYDITEPFGIPLFIVLNKQSECSRLLQIEKKVSLIANRLSTANSSEIKSQATIVGGEASDEVMTEASETSQEEAKESSALITDSQSDAKYDIRYYREGNPKFSLSYRRHARHHVGQPEKNFAEKILNIPHERPHFNNLPLLIEAFLKPQRQNLRLSTERSDSLEPKLDDQNPDANLKVLSDDEDGNLCTPSIIGDDEQRLIGENTDNETNWDNLDSMFSSVDNLPPIENSKSAEGTSEKDSDPEKNEIDGILQGNELLVIDWKSHSYQDYFADTDKRAWENLDYVSNPELEENKRKLAAQQRTTISLYDCLRNFSTPEVLGDQDLWYCPRCKEHRRATKTIQVWSTGDILTFHLKRFQSARSLSDKINMVVDFPIEGLDMTDYVTSSQISKQPLIYDLIAVDNHYGGLGGGHYTASVKNFRDNKWYYFNDSRVTPLEDPKECVTGAAYLLFYKKRSSNQFAGGESVGQFIDKGRNEFEQKLSKLKDLLLQVTEELGLYREQEAVESANLLEVENNEEEDLYEDAEDDLQKVPALASAKKSRSPVTEQNMKFENQRKQRLISKGSDLPRSVNINLNYSSSTSNLASPGGSTDDERDV